MYRKATFFFHIAIQSNEKNGVNAENKIWRTITETRKYQRKLIKSNLLDFIKWRFFHWHRKRASLSLSLSFIKPHFIAMHNLICRMPQYTRFCFLLLRYKIKCDISSLMMMLKNVADKIEWNNTEQFWLEMQRTSSKTLKSHKINSINEIIYAMNRQFYALLPWLIYSQIYVNF